MVVFVVVVYIVHVFVVVAFVVVVFVGAIFDVVVFAIVINTDKHMDILIYSVNGPLERGLSKIHVHFGTTILSPNSGITGLATLREELQILFRQLKEKNETY